MTIKFNCEKCRKGYSVSDAAAGKSGTCKNCGHVNKIPQPALSGIAAKATRTSPAEKAKAMFEVTSSVNGAVFGPADKTTLHQWIKEDRITPDCQIKRVGSENWKRASSVFPQLAAAVDSGDSFESDVTQPATGGSARPANAFARFQESSHDKKTKGFAAAASASTINPYASGKMSKRAVATGEFRPTSGSIGYILNRAFQQFQDNLGTLIAATLIFAASLMFFLLLFYGGIFALAFVFLNGGQPADVKDLSLGFMAIGAVLYLIFLLAGIYLNTGLLGVMLKVGRGEPTNAMDMFSKNNRFLSVLGFGLLAYLVFGVVVGGIGLLLSLTGLGAQQGGPATLLFFVPLFLIAAVIPMLIWPGVFLIVDGKTGVLQAFSVGYKVAVKNVPQFLVISLFAGLIYMAGGLLLIVGILFTFPLALLMITCAYLNMTGQISEATHG